MKIILITTKDDFLPFADYKKMLWWIIAGTKGGVTRGKIILSIKERPRNANQLAEDLKLDYKTVRYHLDILVENKLLAPFGEGYGAVYFPTPELEGSFNEFEEILKKIEKK
ncbi:MAG: winged helix-turn-helix domain-containing protein [Euryarchaeota archaeon]|nr:winged helix-turn-helix domain-containing protein [Euryarchaeota archaeon]